MECWCLPNQPLCKLCQLAEIWKKEVQPGCKPGYCQCCLTFEEWLEVNPDRSSQDKPVIGSARCQEIPGTPVYQKEPAGALDNLKLELQDTGIGSSWSPSPKRSLSTNFVYASPEMGIMSPPVLKRRNAMSKKKKPEMENPLNLVPNIDKDESPFNGTRPTTGKLSVDQRCKEISKRCQRTYSFVIMARYEELLEITSTLSSRNVKFKSTMVRPVLVRVGELEMSPYLGDILYTQKVDYFNRSAHKVLVRLPGSETRCYG